MRMTRLFAVSLLAATTVLFVAAPAHAQKKDGGIGFGLEGGITGDTISGDLVEDVNSKTGWLAGIWFGGNRDGILGFMGELSWVTKGAKENGGPGELNLNYVEIPALLRINIGMKNKNGILFYPLFGPVFDIQVKAQDENGNDIKDFFNGYDVGMMAGAGIEAARIGLEFRFNWGLKEIIKDVAANEFSDLGSVHNRSFQIVAKLRLH